MLASSINEILFQFWDPLEVKNLAPADEYAEYASQLVNMVACDDSIDNIASYLGRIRKYQLMIGPNETRDLETALRVKAVQS